MRWLNVYTHLLPRARAWSIRKGTVLRQIIEGLTIFPESIRREFDRTWLDIFPATTRALDEWEAQWALTPSQLTDAQRRERLSATWKSHGGQSPRYLQDALQKAGFPVYVFDWWIPATLPPVARNPFAYIRGDTAPLGGVDCGEPLALCGEAFAQCGNSVGVPGYLLVNRIQTSRVDYIALCGEPTMQAGEDDAECGAFTDYIFDYLKYNVPVEANRWPYIFYIGGEVFGEKAAVPNIRRNEFEALVLKLKPTHLWAGMFINYT
jgi:hypothetical protein